MLKNEKFYEKSDIEDMLPEAEVTEPGKYWAIGDNGRAYSATYTLKYGGVFFFCIPAAVKSWGMYRREPVPLMRESGHNPWGSRRVEAALL